jgi:hypothetical protein
MTNPNAQIQAVNPFIDGRVAAQAADLVALAKVSAADAGTTTLKVVEVLQGDTEVGASLSVRRDAWAPSVGTQMFVFVARKGADHLVLHAREGRREVVRLLAGLDADDPALTVPEVRALYDAASVVINGRAHTVSHTVADLEVMKVLKGADLLGELPTNEFGRGVVRAVLGHTTTDAGGPWALDDDDQSVRIGIGGFYFLHQGSDGWVIDNPSMPAWITHNDMASALQLNPPVTADV